MSTAEERRAQIEAMTRALMSGQFGAGGVDPLYFGQQSTTTSKSAAKGKGPKDKADGPEEDAAQGDEDAEQDNDGANPSHGGGIDDDNGEDDDDDDDDDDEDESDDDDDDDEGAAPASTSRGLPTTDHIVLKDHTRAVSALALDPAGARLVSGSHDYTVRFWDFNGMDRSLRPFRSMEPCGSYHIRDVQYSITGDMLLVTPSSSEAKVFDRDGKKLAETAKGDMYIRDQNRTSGHVSALTSGTWHPRDKNIFITSGEDFTVRIWDLTSMRKHNQVMIARSTKPGERLTVNVATFNADGTHIAAGIQTGAILIWPYNGPYHRPILEIPHAHMANAAVSSLKYARDNHTLLSRSCDDTVKLWDVRNLKHPVLVRSDLPNSEEHCDAVFSPDEELIAIGTSVVPKKGLKSSLKILKRSTFETVNEVDVSEHSVTRLTWHQRLNQLVVGDSKGDVHMFYNPNVSAKGALLCATKAAKFTGLAKGDTGIGVIINPHALPMFRDEKVRSKKRKLEKLRKDPVASHKPQLPVSGQGKGGRIGGADNFTHQVMKSLNKDTTRDEDPREALLKYAKLAEEDPMFFSSAYKDTQPTPIFDMTEYKDDEVKPKRNRTGPAPPGTATGTNQYNSGLQRDHDVE